MKTTKSTMRGKKMTNRTITILNVILLVAAITSLIASAYLWSSTKQSQGTISIYSARKEDLLMEQQKLRATISDLNKSWEAYSSIEENLTKVISQLSQIPIITPTETAQAIPTSKPPTPAPTRTPRPQRVTRAS